MPAPNLPPGFDFTDPDVYAFGLPVAEFAELRRKEPVFWNEQATDRGGFGDGGYWVVSKHRDVRDVSLRSDVFSSAEKCVVPRYHDAEAASGQIEAGRFSMINMDAPQHTRLRKLISRAFTPRAVEQLRADLVRRAGEIAEHASACGGGDFVAQVSAELPLQAIAGLLGVPFDDRTKLFKWTNEMIGDEDPEFSDTEPLQSAAELMFYGMQLASAKVAEPGDDIVSRLVAGDAEGHKLSDDEFGLFMVTLAVAGSETTRNAITQGMMAFLEHPEQWQMFKDERPPTTVDEVIRWSTPVTAFQRTALIDTAIGDTTIRKGQRVVMFYRSANFDEDVFHDPFTFDIRRDPNPHVGFGGTGAHYCVGANLARVTIGAMLDAIAEHMPHLTSATEPERLRHGWLNGIKHWQVDYTGGGCPATG